MVDEQSIFLQALDRDTPEERAKWLDDICGHESPLRQRIDALLKRHEQASHFLEKPLVEVEGTLNLSERYHPDGNHSVLNALRHMTGELSQVALPEPGGGSVEPMVKPTSPEVPDRKYDSRYQLQGEIAQGGMGAIIRGRDTDLGRDLAIKVLLERHKDKPEVIQRFVEEAQIGGQLQHPGIAPVYELGQFCDGRPFFTMKLVKGQTLSALLVQRDDPAQDRGKFLGIFEQVCQTMAYAHSRGVIHRDLKPANIMVGAFGEVQVMDWGLAKVLSTGGVADERKERTDQDSIIETLRSVGSDTPEGSGSQTRLGSVMGTPAYMSPEQALGETDRLDERSDVFALGAILCVILTGDPPYVGDDSTQVFRQATRGKLDDCFARFGACGADSALIDLAKHCLEVEPNDRPRDAGALAEQVSSYLESVETRLRETELERATQAARAEEERKRRRVTMALAASVLLSFVVAGGGWIYLDKQNSLQEQRRVERKDAAELAVADSLREAEHHAGLSDAEDVGSEDAIVEIDKAVVLAEQAVKSAMQEDVGDLLRSRADQTLNRLTTIRHNTQKELKAANTKRTFLTKLESIRLSQANLGEKIAFDGSYFDNDPVDQDYEKAFRAAGFDLLNLEIPDAVELVRQSSMREEIISALDHWSRWIPEPVTEGEFESYIKAREYKAAAKAGRLLLKETPKNHGLWLRVAPIFAIINDDSGYRSFCQRMTRQFAGTDNVWIAERTCKACLLLPDSVDLDQLPYRTLAESLDKDTAPDSFPYGWISRALFAVRSRNAESALQFLQKCEENKINDEFSISLKLAVRALAQYQLGNADKARDDVKEASSIINRMWRRDPSFAQHHDMMNTHILLREASELLDDKTAAKRLESDRYLADLTGSTDIPLTRREKLLELADLSDTNPWRKSVRNALKAGDIVALKQQLKDEDKVGKQLPSLIAWLGAVLRDDWELETSIFVLRASQRKHPDDFWLNYELAASLSQNGADAEAIEFARAALAIRPESLEAWMALSTALNRAGRVDDHLHVSREILPRIPLDLENSKALGERGRAHQKAGDLDIAAMRRYCERFPNDPRGHLVLSMTLYEHLGKLNEAFRELRKVAALQPQPDDARTYAWYPSHIAKILRNRGRVDDAVEAYWMAIQFAPPNASGADLGIVNTYAQAKMWEEAAASGYQLIEKNPKRLWIWLLQAPVLIRGGNESGYRDHCRRLVERFAGIKQNDYANVTCKVCCLMPGAIDLDQLPVETITKSLDRGTMHAAARPWAWNALALVAYRKAEAERALTYVQFSEDSAPNTYAHSLNLIVQAMALLSLARIDEARIHVGKASKAVDDLPRDVWRYHDVLIAEILLREAKTKLEAVK